jgi:hypothetical protein
MVSACPNESDPRLHVEKFVADDSVRSIAGLRAEGIDTLLDVVKDEIVKQHPDYRIIILDRELMADHDLCFSKELREFARKELASPGIVYFIVRGDIPMDGWQKAFEGLGENLRVAYVSAACRQVPLCVKVV